MVLLKKNYDLYRHLFILPSVACGTSQGGGVSEWLSFWGFPLCSRHVPAPLRSAFPERVLRVAAEHIAALACVPFGFRCCAARSRGGAGSRCGGTPGLLSRRLFWGMLSPWDFSSLGFVTFSHPTVISLVKNVKS